MGQPYVGEIRMVGFGFVPEGWAACNGQLLAISQYSTLYNLIGTTYGGDGQQTFGLPNLLSRVPVHVGTGYVIGALAGTETVTLGLNDIPAHNHPLMAQASAGNQPSPSGGVWAESSLEQYLTAAPADSMGVTLLQQPTGDQPHSNIAPYLAINFIISLFGVYPSQN